VRELPFAAGATHVGVGISTDQASACTSPKAIRPRQGSSRRGDQPRNPALVVALAAAIPLANAGPGRDPEPKPGLARL